MLLRPLTKKKFFFHPPSYGDQRQIPIHRPGPSFTLVERFVMFFYNPPPGTNPLQTAISTIHFQKGESRTPDLIIQPY